MGVVKERKRYALRRGFRKPSQHGVVLVWSAERK